MIYNNTKFIIGDKINTLKEYVDGTTYLDD